MSKDKKTILILEDDINLLAYFERQSLSYFDNIVTFSCIKDAHDYLKENEPHAAIFDNNLPDGQGIDLIRDLDLSKKFPIALITGKGDKNTAIEALNLGVSHYQEKPILPISCKDILRKLQKLSHKKDRINKIQWFFNMTDEIKSYFFSYYNKNVKFLTTLELISIIILIGILDFVSDQSVFSKGTYSDPPIKIRSNAIIRSDLNTCVWGGFDGENYLKDGFCFDRKSKDIFRIEGENAPTERGEHSLVFSNEDLCIFGGKNLIGYLSDGSCYSFKNRFWKKFSDSPLTARSKHTAVWTNKEICFWGGIGWDDNKKRKIIFNDGACYDPQINKWKPISKINAPTPRYDHSAIWTGKKMCIWGGWQGIIYELENTGSCYDPENDSWDKISLINSPTRRYAHSAVWTGTKMCIWGGDNGNFLNDGACYDPEKRKWLKITTKNAPSKRYKHKTLMSNGKMYIFGGFPESKIKETYYNTKTDKWFSR